jgi:UDP-2,3-diacylglucosamine pyrophosphatase LpxH
MKRKIDIVVLSDIYLGSKASKATELLNYLKSIKPQIIILNGNILATQQLKTLPKEHFRVVNRLMKMLSNGTRIYYLTGDSDASLRRFADFNSGNLFLRDQLLLQLGGKKYLFFNGDMIEPKQSFFSKAIKKAFAFLGLKSKSLNKEIDLDFENKVIEIANTEGCDAVVCGHTQEPKIVLNQPIQYFNSGDWVFNMSALEYNYGEWSIYKYDAMDYDIINPKLHVKNNDQDEDDLNILYPKKKKLSLKRPKEFVVVRERETDNWVHNDAVWDGLEL